MPSDDGNRANYWRQLASEALMDAAATTDADAKRLLISISIIYERLALKAEAAVPSSLTALPVVLLKKP